MLDDAWSTAIKRRPSEVKTDYCVLLVLLGIAVVVSAVAADGVWLAWRYTLATAGAVVVGYPLWRLAAAASGARPFS